MPDRYATGPVVNACPLDEYSGVEALAAGRRDPQQVTIANRLRFVGRHR